MYLKWIKDRKPTRSEAEDYLIVTTRDGQVTTAAYDAGKCTWKSAINNREIPARIVYAWMQMPEPCKRLDKTARAKAAAAHEQAVKKARNEVAAKRYRAFVDNAKARGISMTQIAEETGMTKAYISQLYNWGRRCSPELASRIVAVFPWVGSYEYLMGYDAEKGK